jgi:hypothetical protein
MLHTLKRNYEPLGVLFHRVEQARMPDVHFRSYRSEGWLELKRGNRSLRERKVRLPFRPGQLVWAKRYVERGGLYVVMAMLDGQWHVLGNRPLSPLGFDRTFKPMYDWIEFVALSVSYDGPEDMPTTLFDRR